MVLEASEPAGRAASLYAVNGSSYNTAIGRVAFALGLQGPALAIDTACSSSLVAVHLALTGLQQGEADLVPVGGEGCGILVLKRLSEAEADGASTGLAVPSEEAQQQVIVDALRRSGVLSSQVDYVEAHGTGTPVGDPIELRAVATAYGEGRSAEHPLLIGSAKTNFGHLESAGGVATVMKVLLAMQHGVIPKHRNFRDPTPAVDWQRLPLRVYFHGDRLAARA